MESVEGDNGVVVGPPLDGALGYIVIVFDCIAIYNTIELTFIIWGYFKRHLGLYFWSFIVATYGILVYAIGFIIKTKSSPHHPSPYIYVTFIVLGWMAMVTGQSMVLYSRLHLVLRDPDKLRWILYMIIFNAITMHIPTGTMAYGANSSNPAPFVGVYSVYEKIQVTIFFLQELIISSFYIAETIKMARLQSAVQQNRERSRRLMGYLITINVIIILLDCTILGLEYARRYALQTSWKGLVYSVKLKMEFPILNRLKEMTTGYRESSSSPSGADGVPDSAWRSPDWSDGRVHQKRSRGSSQAAAIMTPREHLYQGRRHTMYEAYASSGNDSLEDVERQSQNDTSAGSGVELPAEVMVEMQNRSEMDAARGETPIRPNTCEGSSSTQVEGANTSTIGRG
ncbi:uncharacterized protein J7T54_005811 [Emericellopsis cladophorae]|uniref:DUF7703 domain-containing protein n=1 Tax=Emericellopsis cladophorae TaxID=2686198 RepID=A0A9Q0BBF9_9HYPO|nr:uncharacterized protein J7T54_005811 [Emericellopsis cladophorae]KAI6778024.1 hypothetical protein J7T54_005811 [Emericellopsis cladophorae]